MHLVDAATSVPPGQSAPFVRLTDDDHRDRIIISSAMSVSFVLLTLIWRVIIRRVVNIGWDLDDSILVIASVLHFAQYSLVLASSAKGLGALSTSLGSEHLQSLQIAYYTSNLFYELALEASKAASILFVYRLTSRGSNVRLYSKIVAMLIPVSAVAFIFTFALQCNLSHPWEIMDGSCPNWFLKFEVHAAIACTFEVAIFIAPLWLVWRLHARLPVRINIMIPFALRLIIIPLTGLRLRSFRRAAFVEDPSLALAEYVVWTQWELTYSVLAATFPSTRRSFLDFVTYYNTGHYTDSGHARSRTRPVSESFRMVPLKKKAAASSSVSPHRTMSDDGDSGSQVMIIKRKISFEVATDRDPTSVRSSSREPF